MLIDVASFWTEAGRKGGRGRGANRLGPPASPTPLHRS